MTDSPTARTGGNGQEPDPAERVRALEERLLAAKRRLGQARRARAGVGAERGGGKSKAIPRRPAELSGAAPLSPAQEQLWFIERFAPGLGTYNIPFGLRLRGTLDVGAMAGALSRIVARHEVLRARIAVRGGRPVQVIGAPAPIRLEPVTVTEAALPAALDADGHLPFDLERGPLIRFGLLRLAEDDHVLTATTHHIISDGWSTSLLASELAEFYTAAVEGREPELPELALQYPDFAVWERARMAGDELEGHLRYWEKQLTALPALEFPTDRPRPPAPSFRGATNNYEIPPELVTGLRELARANSASLFMVLMSAFNVVLARLLAVLVRAGLLPDGISAALLRRRLAVFSASARAAAAYQPSRPYHGPVSVIRAEESPDASATWRRFAPRLDVAVVPGDHYTIWHEPNAGRLGTALLACLGETAGPQGPRPEEEQEAVAR